jgi:hypothetical protein
MRFSSWAILKCREVRAWAPQVPSDIRRRALSLRDTTLVTGHDSRRSGE